MFPSTSFGIPYNVHMPDRIPNLDCPDQPVSNDNNVQTEVLASVTQANPLQIPLIPIDVRGKQLIFLLDTGASISIIDKSTFEDIKNLIAPKYLARTVKITTVNSTVKFHSCVQFSFRVGQNFCKHNFYVIDLDGTKFQGILGFDAINKFNINIDPRSQSCTFKNISIPFVKINQKTENVSNINSDNLEQDLFVSKVKLANQVIIQPHEELYVKACVDISNSHQQSLFLFEPISFNSDIESHDSIYSFEPESINSNQNEIHQNNNKGQYSCYLLFKNKSDFTIHLNKSMLVGYLYEVQDTKVPFSSNVDSQLVEPSPSSDNFTTENLNVIHPTEDIINLRKTEFNLEDFNLQHLNNNEQQKLNSLLTDYFNVFSKSMVAMGHTDLVVPDIKLTSNYPVKTLPFPIPQALQQEAKEQIQQLIDANIIEKNISSWSCPMLLVKKRAPEGTRQKFRLALDLRLLNSLIENATYPLPKINNLINELSRYKFFTSLDMPSAYHQIDMPEHLQDMLTFITPWSTYKYKRLVFGLKTAASQFQALMDKVIEEANVDGIFAYQDDLIVASNSFSETIDKLKALFQVLAKHNITLCAAKCSFHQQSVKYLGFQITQNKIFPISSNIVKITSFPRPKTKKQLKTFLGTTGYYRSLIPKYADITQPLVVLTTPKAQFKWTQIHEDAFNELQKIFFSNPFIQQPNFSEPFFLNTDASKTAVSAILLQKHNGKLLPVSYFSKALKNAETRYPAIKLELMAIVRGIQAFKYYLYGRKFTILSDSRPLKYYKKISSPTDITTRWLLQLSEYDFNFEYLPGRDNVLADIFSRTVFEQNNVQDVHNNPDILNSQEVLPVHQEDLSEQYVNNTQANEITPTNYNNNSELSNVFVNTLEAVNTNITDDPLLEIMPKTILRAQLKDTTTSKIYNDILNKKKTSGSFVIDPSSKLLIHVTDPNNSKPPVFRVVLPHTLQLKAITIAHMGHVGIRKTFQKLNSQFFWRGSYADTVNFVKSCDICHTSKHHNIPKAPFQNNYIPKHPGDFISMDLVGPFNNGYHILTIIDHFSRFLSLHPIKTISSENVIQELFNFISVHGRPSLILTDLGRQFTSDIFEDFQTKFGIRLRHTSIANPQANAISERVNTAIKTTITSLEKEGYNFKNAVKIHQMLYNSSCHSTTNMSPNLVHYGRQLSSLYDTYIHTDHDIVLNTNRVYYQLLNDLQQIYNKVYDNLIQAQKIQNQKQYNPKLRKVNVNDLVYLKHSNKLKSEYRGPYRVIKKISPVVFILQRAEENNAPELTIHINRLWIPSKRKKHLKNNVINPQLSPINNNHIPSTQTPVIDNQPSVDSPNNDNIDSQNDCSQSLLDNSVAISNENSEPYHDTSIVDSFSDDDFRCTSQQIVNDQFQNTCNNNSPHSFNTQYTENIDTPNSPYSDSFNEPPVLIDESNNVFTYDNNSNQNSDNINKRHILSAFSPSLPPLSGLFKHPKNNNSNCDSNSPPTLSGPYR